MATCWQGLTPTNDNNNNDNHDNDHANNNKYNHDNNHTGQIHLQLLVCSATLVDSPFTTRGAQNRAAAQSWDLDVITLLYPIVQVWYGTVGQIEDHYGVKHPGVKVVVFNIMPKIS